MDEAEERAYKEKAMLEKLDREARVNAQLLELAEEKFEALHTVALDEALAHDLAVQVRRTRRTHVFLTSLKEAVYGYCECGPIIHAASPCLFYAFSPAIDQTALEEADDAMSFAKKAQQTASKAHVLSSRKNIDVAVARVAACEEVRSFP